MFTRLYRFIFISLLIFSCSSGKKKYDFSIFGGDNTHSPYSSIEFPEIIERKTIEFPSNIISIYQFNSNYFIVCNDGNIYSIDLINYSYDIYFDSEENLLASFYDNEKNIYLINNSKEILKFDILLKSLQWKVNINISETSEVVFHNSNIIVLVDSILLIIDNQDGNILKKINSLYSFTENIYPLIDNNKLYIPSSRGEILCYDLDDLKLIWQYSNDNFFPIIATPVIYSNNIYCFSASGVLSEIDKENGILKNSYNIFPTDNYTYLAIEEDNMFISSYHDFFIVFSLSENIISWEFTDLNGDFIVFKNSIVLNCFEKVLRISKTGEILNNYNVESERIYYIDNIFFSVSKNILNIIF